jgi:hypothetical protein
VTVSNSTGAVTSNTAILTVDATPVAITVNPNNATVTVGSPQQFVGNVTGISNTVVTRTLSGAGCTGAACSTISSNGLYTPPGSGPSPPMVCEGDQRGGLPEISFGKRDNCGGCCGFAKHQPNQCFCPYCWQSTFHLKRDRDFEHGSDLEFERNGLHRLVLWDNFEQFVVSCLFGANHGSFASRRQRDRNQHRGSIPIRFSKCHYYPPRSRHGDPDQRLCAHRDHTTVQCRCLGYVEHRSELERVGDRMQRFGLRND